MLKNYKKKNIFLLIIPILIIILVLFIFFKTYIKIGRIDNKVIKNYFYDLKLQDKSNKDLYILIKYGYTINDILKSDSVIYFKDLNIILKDQIITIKDGYYRKNVIYVNNPLEIKQNNTTILIKKDIIIYLNKLILVGKNVYITNINNRSIGDEIVINLRDLSYNLNRVSGKFYRN
jgi:hypothetical protein